MGDQSSGKSSVLEAISGVPFPRGSGLVTRCPTQLTMKVHPAGFWTRTSACPSSLSYDRSALARPVQRTAPGTPWRATATISRPGGSRPNYGRRSDEIKEVQFPHQLTEVITELTDRVTAGKSFGFGAHDTAGDVPKRSNVRCLDRHNGADAIAYCADGSCQCALALRFSTKTTTWPLE